MPLHPAELGTIFIWGQRSLSLILCYYCLMLHSVIVFFFFFSSRRRHTRFDCDWSSDVCSSDLHRRGRTHPSVQRSHLIGGRMFDVGHFTTHRRGFLGRIAASAAAFGLGGLVAPFTATAEPTATAGKASANPEFEAWLNKITGRHKMGILLSHADRKSTRPNSRPSQKS